MGLVVSGVLGLVNFFLFLIIVLLDLLEGMVLVVFVGVLIWMSVF